MKLEAWLNWHEKTPAWFAEAIEVDVVSVRRYLLGSRRPGWDVMARIVKVTDGEVGPNDFLPVKVGKKLKQVS